MTVIDSSFWQSKYDSNQTGWDRGAASPQLIALCNEGGKRCDLTGTHI